MAVSAAQQRANGAARIASRRAVLAATAVTGFGVFIGATAQAEPSNGSSGGRDYSIHILAKIPSICALRDLSRVIRLYGTTDTGEDVHPHSGVGDFRIECNVPYAIDMHKNVNRRVRARVIPLAADDTVDWDVTLDLPGVEGPLSAQCTNAVLGEPRGCAAIAGADDIRIAKPRAKARLSVSEKMAVIPANDIDFSDAHAEPRAAGESPHLTLSLTAKY